MASRSTSTKGNGTVLHPFRTARRTLTAIFYLILALPNLILLVIWTCRPGAYQIHLADANSNILNPVRSSGLRSALL